jgi:uncharacterized protein YcbK (DUF882 family)
MISANGTLYFSSNELMCPRSKVIKLASGFADALLRLRLEWNRPMKVNSCCRSYEYNRLIGGHPNSLHVYNISQHGNDGTAAIDIACEKGVDKYRLAMLAYRLGWTVGVGSSFLHLDRRGDWGLEPRVLFGY